MFYSPESGIFHFLEFHTRAFGADAVKTLGYVGLRFHMNLDFYVVLGFIVFVNTFIFVFLISLIFVPFRGDLNG